MHPILLTIGHVTISSYLTLYLIAMLVMLGLALARRIRRSDETLELIRK